MYCPQCGKQNTDNVRWCCWCGAPMEAPEASYAPRAVQAERESEPVRPAAPPARKGAPSGGGGKHGWKSGSGRPPRRRKKGRGLIWLLLSLLLLALLFCACMLFFPSFGGFVREHLPFRENERTESVIQDGKELSFRRSDASHIASDASSGSSFVDNELILQAGDASREAVQAAAAVYGGTVVGVNDYLGSYQILFDRAYSHTELESLAAALADALPGAEALPNYCLQIDLCFQPNDSEWVGKWDATPGGTNWGMEAIHAPEMWDVYQASAHVPVNVGVLDNQFYEEHEDLDFETCYLNNYDTNRSKSVHGTHVSGIIAATFNNKKGVAGVAPEVNLFGASYPGILNAGKEDTTIFMYEIALSYLVCKNQCKVINISLGNEGEEQSRAAAARLEKVLLRILDAGYDFLIVKAAGNKKMNYRDYDFFAQITDRRVLSHIITVGAAELGDDGQFYIWDKKDSGSNYGDLVNLIAPGSNIYSTTRYTLDFILFGIGFGSSYGNSSGTSMAAPHVSGVAAVLWSVNPQLSGPEVKRILIETTSGAYGFKGSRIRSLTGSGQTTLYLDPGTDESALSEKEYCYYPMLNGYAAIQKALSCRGEKAGQSDAEPSTPAQSQTAPAVLGAWSEVYRNFVLNQDVVYEDYGSQLFGGKTFTLGSQRYYQDMYSFPKFSLHDMDADGVPELVAFNGAAALAEKLDYVYSCRDNSILYLGTVGFRGCELFCCDGAAFPGLFCSEGNNGVYRTEYYTIGNDRIVTEHVRDFSRKDNGEEYSVQITADNALYALSVSGGERTLVFYSMDEIRAMGWESFVETVLRGVSVPAAAPVQEAAQGRVVSMTQEQQRAASLFLSNFAEQHTFEARGFDAGSPDLDDLVGFAYLYCKINRGSSLSVAQSGGNSYYTLSLANANAVWQRHFGITLSESEAAQYPQRDQSAYGQFQSFYSDGSFYFPAADGESYNRLAIARQMENLGDGTYQVLFDIYKLDIAEYQRGNGSVDSAYYSLSADEARTNRNLTWQASGTAVVRPYVNNGNQTYQLVRYSVD